MAAALTATTLLFAISGASAQQGEDLRDAAQNPSGGAGTGVGLGAGFALGNAMAGAMNNAMNQSGQAQSTPQPYAAIARPAWGFE